MAGRRKEWKKRPNPFAFLLEYGSFATTLQSDRLSEDTSRSSQNAILKAVASHRTAKRGSQTQSRQPKAARLSAS